jgi:hypothetical protein
MRAPSLRRRAVKACDPRASICCDTMVNGSPRPAARLQNQAYPRGHPSDFAALMADKCGPDAAGASRRI